MDLISRQAAIDALREIEFSHYMEFGEYIGEDTREVQLIRAEKAQDAIEQLPSAQTEQRWIPCSERLPEHSERYLVSVLDGIDRRTTVAPYHPRSRTWSLTGRMAYWKVIAWMPLPEPYRERREE